MEIDFNLQDQSAYIIKSNLENNLEASDKA